MFQILRLRQAKYIKKFTAIALCIAFAASCIVISTNVLAAGTVVTNDFESSASSQVTAYYTDPSNAIQNLSNQGQYADFVNQAGIGYNGSGGAMRLRYTGNSATVAAFSLANTNAATYSTYKPESGKTYKLSLWYKTENVSADATIRLFMRPSWGCNLKTGGPNLSEAGAQNIAVGNIALADATNGQWKHAENILFTGTGNGGVYIVLDALKENRSGLSVLVDNIVIEEVTELTTVSFNSNGGTSVPSVKGVNGMPISFPAAPSKPGFKFDGWYTDDVTFLNKCTVYPATDIVLYAKWIAVAGASVCTQDFESLPAGTLTSLKVNDNKWQISTEQNHTANGTKAAQFTIAKNRNGQMNRPRIIIGADGSDAVLQKDKGYDVSFWVYLPAGQLGANTQMKLKYYIASLSDTDKITSNDKADHCIEGNTDGEGLMVTEGQWTLISIGIDSLIGMGEDNYLEIGLTDEASWMADYTAKTMYIDDIVITARVTDTDTQSFESFSTGTLSSLRVNPANWQIVTETNHTDNGSKAAQFEIARNAHAEMTRPRMVYNLNGRDVVLERGKAYEVSFWIYVPTGQFSGNSVSLKYYVASLADASKVTSRVKTDHHVEGNAGDKVVKVTPGQWTEIKVSIASLEGLAEDNYLEIGITDPNAWQSGYTAKRVLIDDIKVTETTALSGVQDFESLPTGALTSLKVNNNNWQVSTEQNHTASGTKSAQFTIAKGKNGQMNRPRIIANINGTDAVLKRGTGYKVSFWLYLPEGQLGSNTSLTLNYYIASLSDTSKITSNNKADHYIEASTDGKTVSVTQGQWTEVSVIISSLEGMAANNFLEIGITDSNSFMKDYTSKKVYIDDIAIEEYVYVPIDTDYGVQDYESYEVKLYEDANVGGIHGNASGREVSDEYNHTANGSKSIKLKMNGVGGKNSAQTVMTFSGSDLASIVGQAYEFSFWMYLPGNSSETEKITWYVSSAGGPLNYLAKEHNVEKQGDITLNAGEWKQITVRIPNLAGASQSGGGLITLGASFPSASTNNIKYLYVDDVSAKAVANTSKLVFHSQGGNNIKPINAFKGEILGTLPVPIRDNYAFDGWFNQDGSVSYGYNTVMPDVGTLELYAKWSALPSVPYSLETGFEESEYSVQPYQNDGTNPNISAVNMTQSATWLKNADFMAETGNASLQLQNTPFIYTNGGPYQAAALMNPDGSRFMVVKGAKYKISYSYLGGEPDTAHSYIAAVISSRTASAGISAGSGQMLKKSVIHGVDEDWSHSEECFVATETGFVYFTISARTSTSSTSSAGHYGYIDNVKVEALSDSEYTSVSFMSGTSKVGMLVGKKGDPIVKYPVASTQSGKELEGWYTDAGLSNKFTGSVYPDTDISVYANYITADYTDAKTDFTNPKTISFEETQLLRDWMSVTQHITNNGDGILPEVELISNDSANAHSGSSYLRFNALEWHYSDVKLMMYDTASKYNIMYLEPQSSYKVSLWIKSFDDFTGTTLLLFGSSPSSMSTSPKNLAEIGISSDDMVVNTWQQAEAVISNDTNDTMALLLVSGKGAQTCLVDDLSILKLREVTVSFNTNGGSTVDSQKVTIGFPLEEPGAPVKDGYSFAGWYTDAALKNAFKISTEVMDDMTLYAKWIRDAGADITDDGNATVDKVTEIDNGKRPSLLDSDPVSTKPAVNDGDEAPGMQLWLIILISAVAGIVVIGGAAVITIVLLKKKKTRQH